MIKQVKELYSNLEKTKDVVGQVDLLAQIAEYFTNIDLQRCFTIADEIIEIATPISYYEGLAEAYYIKAKASSRTMKYEEAIAYFQEAISYLAESNNLILKAKVLNSLGIVYSHSGKFELSISCSEKAVEYYEQATDQSGQKSNSYNNIGNCYSRMGDFDNAEIYYTKAIEIMIASGNTARTTNLKVNLALIHNRRGNYEESQKRLFVCRQEFVNADHKLGIAETTMGIAHNYRQMGKNAEAVDYYIKAIALQKAISNKESLAECYIGLAKVYFSLNGCEEAMSQIKLSEAILKEIEYPNGRINMLYTKAHILQKINQESESEMLIVEAKGLAKKFGIDYSAFNL